MSCWKLLLLLLGCVMMCWIRLVVCRGDGWYLPTPSFHVWRSESTFRGEFVDMPDKTLDDARRENSTHFSVLSPFDLESRRKTFYPFHPFPHSLSLYLLTYKSTTYPSISSS